MKKRLLTYGLSALVGLGVASKGSEIGTPTGVQIKAEPFQPMIFPLEVIRHDLDGLTELLKVAPNFMAELISRNPMREICVDSPVLYPNEGKIEYAIFLDEEKVGVLAEGKKSPWSLTYSGRLPGYVNECGGDEVKLLADVRCIEHKDYHRLDNHESIAFP